MLNIIQWFAIFIAGACCAGFIFLLYRLWQTKWGQSSKALQRRLQNVVLGNQRSSDKSLFKQTTIDTHPLLNWLTQHIKLIQFLQLLMLRAGSQWPLHDMLKLLLTMGILGFLLSLLLTGNIGIALVLTFAAVLLPIVYLWRQAKTRQHQFDNKFPEALDFLSRALRAGHGLTAAIGMLADEFPGTVGEEFKIAFDEINFGLSFNQALSNMTERIDSQDLNFFVIALLIQRETGGNLAELLSGLAATVRERMKLAGMVRTISAEGKLSGLVVGILPFVLMFIIHLLNPAYISILWTTESGQDLIAFGLVIMTLGGLTIWKMVQIKL
jgi:tight adherence protein B